MSTNGHDEVATTHAEYSAELEQQNVLAAIQAAEKMYVLATKGLRERGLATGDPETDWAAVIGDLLAETELRIMSQVAEALAPLIARIDALEATQLTDGGIWRSETFFRPNQVATYRGAMWLCKEPNSNVRPGTSSAWRLMHKTTGGGRHDD